MHDDEFPTDSALVRRLLAVQFPAWAALPIVPVRSYGTSNALYRLGDGLVARLPRTPGTDLQIAKEARWLPQLAPQLPLAIPTPLALGAPGEGYPWRWSVVRWLGGADAAQRPFQDPLRAATELAAFVAALAGIDATGGPGPGRHNFRRGEPLLRRDDATRAAIAELAALGDPVDGVAATAVWEGALQAAPWPGPPRWIHGDLHALNLLVDEGGLAAVIDFGGLGVGDPACDLMAAWTLFGPEARARFRAELAPDEDSWVRGRGWAISFGLIALPYYLGSNPVLADIARNAIDQALAEFRSGADGRRGDAR
jgi:aminoglycoside phosphotransferase (APT) family kinase protein